MLNIPEADISSSCIVQKSQCSSSIRTRLQSCIVLLFPPSIFKKKIDSSFSTRFPRVTFQLSSLPRPPPSIQLPIFCFSSTPTLLWDACPTGKYGCLPYRQTAAGAERRCTVTHWRHMRVLRTSPPPLLLDVRSVL